MDKKSINEKIAKGEFEIFVEAEVTSNSQKFMTLDSLVVILKRYITILDKITPERLGNLIPIVMTDGHFSIAIGLVLEDQGSLIEESGNLEESARREILEKFKVAEKASIASIKEGNKIAKEMLKSTISREQLEGKLMLVEDESVARNVIDLARYTKMTLDFKHASQTVGGSLEIAKDVVGTQKFSYRNCKIVSFIGNGDFDIEADNYGDYCIPQDSRKNLIRVNCDPYSKLNLLMHLAGSVSARFDCDVRVIEEIKNRKLKLMVINLPDPMQILSSVESNLTELKKTIQIGFDFN